MTKCSQCGHEIQLADEISPKLAMTLLEKLGQRYGTDRHQGTWGAQDPTHFERWKLVAIVDPGFGPPIVTKQEDNEYSQPSDTFPPSPELVVVQWNNVTWGVTARLISDTLDIEGYWCPQSRQWLGVEVRKFEAQLDPRGGFDRLGHDDSLVVRVQMLHQAIVRLIVDGDWGNDKMFDPQDEEAEFQRSAAESLAGWDAMP